MNENNIQITWVPPDKVQYELESSRGLTSPEDDVTWCAYLMHSSSTHIFPVTQMYYTRKRGELKELAK